MAVIAGGFATYRSSPIPFVWDLVFQALTITSGSTIEASTPTMVEVVRARRRGARPSPGRHRRSPAGRREGPFWPREQVALEQIAAEFGELVALGGRLDPLGDDQHPQLVAQILHRANDALPS